VHRCGKPASSRAGTMSVRLARLRLRLWLCSWSGFCGGAEVVSEKRLAKQLLLTVGDGYNCEKSIMPFHFLFCFLFSISFFVFLFSFLLFFFPLLFSFSPSFFSQIITSSFHSPISWTSPPPAEPSLSIHHPCRRPLATSTGRRTPPRRRTLHPPSIHPAAARGPSSRGLQHLRPCRPGFGALEARRRQGGLLLPTGELCARHRPR
jgi:hypothetical protein